MRHHGRIVVTAGLALGLLVGFECHCAEAQELLPNPATSSSVAFPQESYRLTLEEAKQRALSNSKLRSLALMNVQAKQFATCVAAADYYPKLLASFAYFHFDEPLGKVLTIRPNLPTVAVNLVEQDASLGALTAVQPITALLKVNQAVRIAEADGQIAQSQAVQADIAIVSGVEQLYYGLLAVQRILAAAQAATDAAEKMKGISSLQLRIAAVEAKQAIQKVAAKGAGLQEQLNGLLDFPLSTRLELVEVPPLVPTICSAEEAIQRALSYSPEIVQADQDVVKAEAALRVAQVDFLPDVNVLGGYVSNNATEVIQNEFSYLGVMVNCPLYAGGKRVYTVRQSRTVLAMARQKACQTRDEMRLKAQTAYTEYVQAEETLKIAEEMLEVRKEAQQQAVGAEELFKTAAARMQAEAGVVQADASRRVAYAKLREVVGRD